MQHKSTREQNNSKVQSTSTPQPQTQSISTPQTQAQTQEKFSFFPPPQQRAQAGWVFPPPTQRALIFRHPKTKPHQATPNQTKPNATQAHKRTKQLKSTTTTTNTKHQYPQNTNTNTRKSFLFFPPPQRRTQAE